MAKMTECGCIPGVHKALRASLPKVYRERRSFQNGGVVQADSHIWSLFQLRRVTVYGGVDE